MASRPQSRLSEGRRGAAQGCRARSLPLLRPRHACVHRSVVELRLPSSRGRRTVGLPSEEKADVTGHPTRILEDFGPQPETERPEVIAPEFVTCLRTALQGLLPLGQRVVDPSATIATERIRKAIDLDLALP